MGSDTLFSRRGTYGVAGEGVSVFPSDFQFFVWARTAAASTLVVKASRKDPRIVRI